jgi:hypothetical protein
MCQIYFLLSHTKKEEGTERGCLVDAALLRACGGDDVVGEGQRNMSDGCFAFLILFN